MFPLLTTLRQFVLYPNIIQGCHVLLANDMTLWSSQMVLVVKNLPAHAGDVRDVGLIPGSGRPPGAGYGHPLQYSCLGNAMYREAYHGIFLSFPGGSDSKESACNAGDLGLNPGSGSLEKEIVTHSRILAWEFHGQKSLAGYSLWGRQELDITERLTQSHFLSLHSDLHRPPSPKIRLLARIGGSLPSMEYNNRLPFWSQLLAAT